MGLDTENYFIGAAAACSASKVSAQDPRCRDRAMGGGGGEQPSALIAQMSWAFYLWCWGWYAAAQDVLQEFDYHVHQEFSCIWYPIKVTTPLYDGRDTL